MKKIKLIFIMCIIAIMLNPYAYADGSRETSSESKFEFVNPNSTGGAASEINLSTTIINEVERMVQLNKLSDEELVQQGYNIEEIASIRNYKELANTRINELAKLDRLTLAKKGYSDAQINAIYNYTQSDTQLQLLAGTLTMSIYIDDMYYNETSGRSHARLNVTFNWSTEPLYKFTDAVGIAWNGPMEKIAHAVSILYEDMDGIENSYYSYTAQAVVTGPVNAGVGFKFPMKQFSGVSTTYYAKSGRFVVVLEVAGHINLAAYTEYGHALISITGGPSLSIPGGFSISFSPTYAVEIAGSAYTASHDI